MDKLRFGPSGNCELFYAEGNKSSLQAPSWLKKKGLDAYEYSFTRGFTIKDETAVQLGKIAEENDILISAHAPYYINLANPSEEMIQKSFGYITRGLELLKLMKGKHYCLHLASCGKLPREKALELTKVNLKRIVDQVKGFCIENNMFLCPETMGKPMQIGTYEEIIELCTIDEILVPTFDFGHINALSGGGLKTYEDYKKIIDLAIEKLGERAKSCHVHFSKIEYGDKGEIRHLNYNDNDYGPDFGPFAKLIKEYNLTPTIICESKNFMTEDAMQMQQIYKEVSID